VAHFSVAHEVGKHPEILLLSSVSGVNPGSVDEIAPVAAAKRSAGVGGARLTRRPRGRSRVRLNSSDVIGSPDEQNGNQRADSRDCSTKRAFLALAGGRPDVCDPGEVEGSRPYAKEAKELNRRVQTRCSDSGRAVRLSRAGFSCSVVSDGHPELAEGWRFSPKPCSDHSPDLIVKRSRPESKPCRRDRLVCGCDHVRIRSPDCDHGLKLLTQ